MLSSKIWLISNAAEETFIPLVLDIDTVQATSNIITLTGLNQSTCTNDIVIEWGDGSITHYVDIPSTGNTTHTYPVGAYKTVITVDRASFTLGRNANMTMLVGASGRLPMPFTTPNLVEMFSGSRISSIDPELFYHYGSCTDVSYMYYSCSLAEIPSNALMYLENIINCSNIFAANTTLSTIGEELFLNSPNISNLNLAFFNSIITTIPTTLFDPVQNVSNFTGTFQNCRQITSSVPELWTRTNVTANSFCFYNCSLAANYADIPSGWK